MPSTRAPSALGLESGLDVSQAAASWGARLGVLAVPTLRSIGGRVASTHGFQELDNFLLEVEVREHLWRTHQKVLAEVGGSTHWLALRSGLGEDDMDDFDQDQPEEEWTDFDDDDDEEEEYDSDDDDEDEDDDGGWAEPAALFASVLSPTVDAKALAAARAALSAIQGKRAVHLLLSADRLGSDPLTGAPEVTYKTQEAGARGWTSTAVLAGGARVRGDVCTKKKDAENGAALAAAAALIAHYTSTCRCSSGRAPRRWRRGAHHARPLGRRQRIRLRGVLHIRAASAKRRRPPILDGASCG